MLIERGERGFARRNDSSFLRTASRGGSLRRGVVRRGRLLPTGSGHGPNVSVPLTVCDWHATTLITEPYLGVTIFLQPEPDGGVISLYTLSMVRTVASAYTVADDNDDVASLLVDFVGTRPRALRTGPIIANRFVPRRPKTFPIFRERLETGYAANFVSLQLSVR